MVAILPVFLQAQQQQPQRPAAIPSIDDRTNGMKKIDGYFPLYWDERTGSMFLEIPRLDSDVLFSLGLSAGLGSNDIGLDRGQGGGGRIVQFQRVGPRVMMVQANQSFRSSSKNPARTEVGRRLICEIDPVGVRGRGGIGRAFARRCHRLFPARYDGRGKFLAARQLSGRSDPQRILSAEYEGLPQKH